MKINACKTRVISFSRKTNMLTFHYVIYNSVITSTDCINDLSVFLDAKRYFNQHVDYLFSHTIKLLGLIGTITPSFSSLDSLMMLYSSPLRSKLEHASLVWNSLTTTDFSKLERIQEKFATLYYNRIFKNLNAYKHNWVLDKLKLNILQERRRNFDVLFIRNVCNGFIACPSLLQTVGIRVPNKNFRYFNTFYTLFSYSKCPSVHCALATNEIRNRPNVNMFDN
jgi:hypothetical protein